MPLSQGSPMDIGTLRYGVAMTGEFGETVEWRHWGCVTPATINQLAAINLDDINGFKSLIPQDQQKIRLAISLRRIDPSDIPDSAKAKVIPSTLTNERPSQKKRKAEQERAMASQGGSSRPEATISSTSRLRPTLPTASQLAEDEKVEEPPEEEVRDELYCTMNTNVVGIQYYKGLVGPGEEVMLIREPQNPYDKNAIQVKNVSQTQVGHLPKAVAAKLASLMDQRLVTVEGVINDGNLTGRSGYTLSISSPSTTVSNSWAVSSGYGRHGGGMSAQPSGALGVAIPQREALRKQEALLKQQEALQKAAELRQMLSTLEKVDDEGRRSSLLDTLCSTDDVLNLPLHPNPPGIKNGDLTVDLLKHQSQALQWCVEREYPTLPKMESDKPVQFWLSRKNGNKHYYYNIATKTPQEEAPLLGRGALCADAMGLGKTLTMLALILATKNDIPQDFSNSTLIVAPLSVLSNWEKQVIDHCTAGSLSMCTYYNTTRSTSASELAKFDVVITTYQTVAGEHPDGARDGPVKKKKKTERSLFDMQWKVGPLIPMNDAILRANTQRIILDEGHTIRNPKTKMAKAVCGLNAQRRWVLTGTPIINSPRDLRSILTFLQICRPLDNEEFYKRLLLRPLKDGAPSGVELLREVQVEMIIVPVTLSDEARTLYDNVEELSKKRFENFMNRGTGSLVQSNVLSMLTRMRQLALHPGLVPANYLEELRKMGSEDEASSHQTTQLTAAEILRLRGLLARALEDFEECPICFCVMNDARITSCGHMFCFPCITEVISRDPKCPMDRRVIGMGDLYEPPPPTDLTQVPIRREEELDTSGIRGGSSAKIDQLVHLLKLTPGSEKSLVFSQFTSFLDKIAETLEAEGIPFCRLDGQMSAKRRQETIAQFSIPIAADLDSSSDDLSLSSNLTSRDSDDYMDEDDDEDDEFIVDKDDHSIFSGKRKANKKTKAKGKGRMSASGTPGENPKVMLLSLKAEGIESQAIDRVNRIGQNKPVHVYQIIAENTVESKVIEIQERKKQLIQQAFSGIKRTETQRHQREARLQGGVPISAVMLLQLT
ncbi:hypothetical protein H0H81_011022 [Sphagnurus paluster]|uniref:Uncharacterized protein n=1 Tax=Sphagnurus paluster TaxID=117069 RepID=A0A9P7K3L0_9AGAR|nr:hypothetical protein H0H81_011022 [Sphagnurus paluster]